MNGSEVTEISTITRSAVFDELELRRISLCGKRDEVAFLSRVFDLSALPSNDYRFTTMAEDVWQHRINNPQDWPDNWVLTDSRLNLMNGPDDIFLNVLCEMVHPLVRSDAQEISLLLEIFNKHLIADGWQISEKTRISGRPIYAAHRLMLTGSLAIGAAKDLAEELNSEYLMQQVNRMESAITNEPDVAIGTAKEFVESICRGILKQRGITLSPIDDFPSLVKLTVKSLQLVPYHVQQKAEAENTVKVLINNLSSVGRTLAELRNPYGTGHGKDIDYRGLEAHHARLAVGVATAVGIFLFEAHRSG